MNLEKLISFLNPEDTFLDEPLSKHTSLRIGGPADILYRARSINLLIKAVRVARELSIPVTVLGWGSNVLVSDMGIRGLVIKNEAREIIIKNSKTQKLKTVKSKNISEKARWQGESFGDLDYDESGSPRVRVIMDSGVSLQMAMNDLFTKGITGLQWFARIPGTIGGAVYNNIHGGTRFISEVVKKVRVLDHNGKIKIISGKDLGLDYDKSRFHSSEEIILSVEFELFRGDVEKARCVAMEWARRKSLQPPRSAGCTFMNISNEDKEMLKLPTTSVGYIIEHILKLGGHKIGGAKISTAHHNFIVNDGGATAKDYLALVKLIQRETKKKLGINLEPEIIYLGEF